MATRWQAVGTADDFEDDRFAWKDGLLHIGIFRIEGELFAIDNLCTHGNALLTDGEIEDCLVECPLHAGLVDLRTGKPAASPIVRPTRTYAVREEDGAILIELPA